MSTQKLIGMFLVVIGCTGVISALFIFRFAPEAKDAGLLLGMLSLCCYAMGGGIAATSTS